MGPSSAPGCDLSLGHRASCDPSGSVGPRPGFSLYNMGIMSCVYFQWLLNMKLSNKSVSVCFHNVKVYGRQLVH